MNIYINKINAADDGICYQVTFPGEKDGFYIKIFPSERQVAFYKSRKFDKPIKIIDLSDAKKAFDLVPGINLAISNRVCFQAYKAILKSEYPDSMSYECH